MIIEWLLGGASVVGVLGSVGLGIAVYKVSRDSRSDLLSLNKAERVLEETRSDLKTTKENLKKALMARSQEQSGLAVAMEALNDANEELLKVKNPDPATIAARINRSLLVLSKISAVSADDSPSNH